MSRAPRRRPRLLLGLGNPLMGDDGVGWHLVERLRGDPRVPPQVEVAWGGTDLLGCAGLLAGRERVVLVDAVEVAPGRAPGEVIELEPDLGAFERSAAQAHALCVAAAVALLRRAGAALAGADLRLLGVTVRGAAAGERLTTALARRLPEIERRILAALSSSSRPAAPW